MGYPAQITDHVAQAQARLIAQFITQPQMLKLVAALAGRAQVVENALYAVATQRALAAAIGQQLDGIGKIVGLPRTAVPGGSDDAVYRIWLRVQVRVNQSKGTAPDLISIVQIAADPGASIQVLDSGACGVRVVVGGVSLTQYVAISAALQAAKAAGVLLVTEYLATTSALSFTFDGTPAQALDAGLFAGSI